MFVDEQEVALDLFVEGIRNVHTAHVVWARLGPHAAHLTGVAYFWDQVEDVVRDSYSLEETTHYRRGGVPPADVKLPKRETVCAYTACSEESNYSADVEVRPVGRVLRILARAFPGASVPGDRVRSSSTSTAQGFSRLASARVARWTNVWFSSRFGSFRRRASAARTTRGSIRNSFGFLGLPTLFTARFGGAESLKSIGLLDRSFGFGAELFSSYCRGLVSRWLSMVPWERLMWSPLFRALSCGCGFTPPASARFERVARAVVR